MHPCQLCKETRTIDRSNEINYRGLISYYKCTRCCMSSYICNVCNSRVNDGDATYHNIDHLLDHFGIKTLPLYLANYSMKRGKRPRISLNHFRSIFPSLWFVTISKRLNTEIDESSLNYSEYLDCDFECSICDTPYECLPTIEVVLLHLKNHITIDSIRFNQKLITLEEVFDIYHSIMRNSA